LGNIKQAGNALSRYNIKAVETWSINAMMMTFQILSKKLEPCKGSALFSGQHGVAQASHVDCAGGTGH